MDFPRTVDEITPEWLTQVLRENGAVRDAVVESFEIANVGEDQGLTADVSRVDMYFDHEEPGTPRSAIIKMPRADILVDMPITARNTYEREIRFFQTMGSGSGMRTPLVYFAAVDSATGAFVLLLEDLNYLRAVDQADDCSFEDASACLLSLATMHAKWWNNTELPAYSWLLDRPFAIDPILAQQRMLNGLEPFLDMFGDYTPTGIESLVQKLTPKIPEIAVRISSSPATLVHGDFKLGNIFFDDSAEGADKIVAFDWQLAGRVKSASDVATFVMQSFSTKSRRQHEHQLLAEYHASLTDLGVEDYSYDRFISDIQVSMLPRLITRVNMFSHSGQRLLNTPDGMKRAKKMLGSLQMLIDWNCDEVIPK
jgi:hypothetical protein